jgi:hypothetical protein
MTINLNVGNIWTHSYLDKVIELNKSHYDVKVKSLFGSVAELTPTARSFDRLPSRTDSFIMAYVEKARQNNIHIRYTLNQSCIGPIQDFKVYFDDVLKNKLHWLHSIGIYEWTVTSPLLVEILRNMFPDDFIEVSTIAEVSTIQDVERWAVLGANGANVSTSINRDFRRLRAMNKVLEVSILSNEACLYRCPWRRECYNLSSHDSRRSEELFGYYPFRRCNEVRLQHPEEWLRSRLVLPQWLPFYVNTAGIKWFKVAYRTHPEEVAIPLLEAYMNLHFGGNLCALWPTISKLGNTAEPKDVTNISCDKLDELKFIDKWLLEGDLCGNRLCSDCMYCQTMYDSCKK